MSSIINAAKKIENIPTVVFQDADFGHAKTYYFPRTAGPRSPPCVSRQEKKRETKIARRHKEKTRQKRRNHDRKVHGDVNNKVVHESDDVEEDCMEMLEGIYYDHEHQCMEMDDAWDYLFDGCPSRCY